MNKPVLNFNTRRPERLRDREFLDTYTEYETINDLADAYLEEIVDTFLEYGNRETDVDTVMTLLTRALYACYKRGFAEGKEIERAGHISSYKPRK